MEIKVISTANEEVIIAIGRTKTGKTQFLEEMMLRFPHIVRDIFKKVDNKSLTNFRNVSRVYCDFIDYEFFHSVRKIQGRERMTEFQQQWDKVLKNIPTQVRKEIFGTFEKKFQYDWYRKKLLWSPLYIAVETCQHELCKFMIERIKDANPMRKDGITEIHMATFAGLHENCELLKSHFTTTMTNFDHILTHQPPQIDPVELKLHNDRWCEILNQLSATSDRLGVTMHPAQPDWTF